MDVLGQGRRLVRCSFALLSAFVEFARRAARMSCSLVVWRFMA